jgi:hypothetical protein
MAANAEAFVGIWRGRVKAHSLVVPAKRSASRDPYSAAVMVTKDV